MHLIKFIDHRSFRIISHSCCPHFMNTQTDMHFLSIIACHLLKTCCIKHFHSIFHDIFSHSKVIIIKGGIKNDQRNTPFIFFNRIQKHSIVRIGQNFPKATKTKGPFPWLGKFIFEIGTESLHTIPPIPSFSTGTTLITISPHEIFCLIRP